MAINAEGTLLCKVTHTENGRVTTRRIHWMTVQAIDGRLYHLSGKALPDAISLFSGEPHKAEHLAEVLMNSRHARPSWDLGNWPKWRDFIHFVSGFFSCVFILIVIEVIRCALE